MASIEKHRGRWRVRWREGGRGSPLLRSEAYDTKPLAQLAADRIEAKLSARKAIRPGSIVGLEELLQRWVISRGVRGNDPAFTEQGARRIRHHVQLAGWANTLDITPSSIEAWKTANPGLVRACSYLRAFVNWCKDYADQPVDPAALVALKPPRSHRKPPGSLLTDREVDGLERTARRLSADAGALIHCLRTYGWRPITAARMSCGVVQGDMIRCEIKGGDTIEHPLLPQTVKLLRAAIGDREPGEPLFRDPRTGEAFKLTWTGDIPSWSRLWLKVNIYQVKRYAISGMLSRGMSLADIARFTGHKTPSQILRYARTNETSQRAALKLLGHTRGTPGRSKRHQAKARSAKTADKPLKSNQAAPGKTP